MSHEIKLVDLMNRWRVARLCRYSKRYLFFDAEKLLVI